MDAVETFLNLFPQADTKTTVRPHVPVGADWQEWLSELPRWESAQLQLGEVLGEGGMGLVRVADQPGLGRSVAVKMLKPKEISFEARQRIMMEAWATAMLEHPQIVPVYSAGVDENNSPCIVLKKIEGRVWTDLIFDEQVGEPDRVAHHLQILTQICHAVAFAHDRGVLHRDLKPDNIMIGSFGEVYLLDWGLAMDIDGRYEGRLPVAQGKVQIAGSPNYMAPEQLRGLGLGPGTDVFGLGGLLYTITHGKPPHMGEDVRETLRSVQRCKVPIDAGLPEELQQLLKDSLHLDARQRPSALEFGGRLTSHLSHRGAVKLADTARVHLRELSAELKRDTPNLGVVQACFGACRFGYRQALQVWPDQPDAQAEYEKACHLMVSFHLGRKELAAAKALLTKHPNKALQQQLDTLATEQQTYEESLAALAGEHDLSFGVRTRLFTASIVILSWCTLPVGRIVFRILGTELGYWHFFLAFTVETLLVAGLLIWARETMMKTAPNRALAFGMLFGPALPVFVMIPPAIMQWPVNQAYPLVALSWAILTLILNLLSPARVLPAVVSFFLTFVISVVLPGSLLLDVMVLMSVLLVWASLVYNWTGMLLEQGVRKGR